MRRGAKIRLVRSGCCLGALLPLLVACGSTAPAARPGATVTLRNFRIDTAPVWPAGPVTIEADGVGPSMHELNLTRWDSGLPLPVNARGNVDDSGDGARVTHLVEVEAVDIGDRRRTTVELTPGRYVVYCNMDGHFHAGMSTTIEVRA